MADREIKIVISAQDDYTAALSQFKTAMGDTTAHAGHAEAGFEKLKGTIESLAGRWLELATIGGAVAFLAESRSEALKAEESFNKLRIQVEKLGLNYNALEGDIDKALNKTAEYAIVQDDAAAVALQQLILQTGNYQKALANLNVVYDLAYLKNIDAGEAATIVGKAVAGNVEGLSRMFPELKNVDELLGKHATTASKAAYAQAFLAEKVEGAKEKMSEHAKSVERLKKAWDDTLETTGKYILKITDFLLLGFEMDKQFQAREALLVAHGQKITEVGQKHTKTAAEIAAASKKESDALEKKKKEEEQYLADLTARLKAFKVPEGDNSLSASIFGELNTPAAKKGYELSGITYGEITAKGMVEGISTGFDKIGTLNLDMGRFTKAFIPEPDAWAEALFFARVDAMGKLADLEKDNPYKYQKGTGGAMADVGLEYQTKLQALQDYNTQKLGLMAAAGATQYEVEAEYERLTTSMKKQELDLRLSAASSYAGGMANFFQNLYVAGGKHNRALFEMGKAFAIAEAVMNTASAATKALRAPPGPPWSLAYVAATVAAGAAQIATIMSTKPDGAGAISAAGTAMPSYSGGSPSAYPIPTALTPDSKPTQTIVINFQNAMGDAAYFQKITEENLIPAINAAADRNIAVTVKGAA